jgi:membrane protein YqaA with SNARE-associated domain
MRVPKPNVIRRLYAWTLSWAERPGGFWALGIFSFVEASVFPIPPDPLLMALCYGKPRQWWSFALLCTGASVAGGMFAWWIGAQLWHLTGQFFFAVIPGFTPERFETVQTLYNRNAFLAILAAAFTPIPYKIFTVASGVFRVALGTLVLASVVGRGARYLLVGGVIRIFGPVIKPHLEKHLETVTLISFLLAILSFLALKWLR